MAAEVKSYMVSINTAHCSVRMSKKVKDMPTVLRMLARDCERTILYRDVHWISIEDMTVNAGIKKAAGGT